MDGSVATGVMIAARIMVVLVALAGGLLMIKYPTVEANLRINAVIVMINPLLLTFVNLVGVGALAGKVPLYKLGLILAGALFIVLGTRMAKKRVVDGSGGGPGEKAASEAGSIAEEGMAVARNNIAARAMVVTRFLIVAVALAAVILMFIFRTVEAGLRINAAVALVNPLLTTVINLIGVTGMAGRVSWARLGLVLAGTALIIAGTI